jgi:outer membrane immunogenic protein
MTSRTRTVGSAALFALALALPAGAADLGRMPTRAPVMAPPPPPFTWTGCYIGGFVGGAFTSDSNAVFTDLGNGTFASFSGGITAPGVAGIHSWAVPLDDSSFIGGGTLGCNYQFVGSPFVIGIEGEGGYLKLSGAAFDPLLGPNTPIVAPFTPDVLGVARIGDWYAMATGRLGYAFDRWMIYVKGGAAFLKTRANVIDNCTSLAAGCGNWQIATFSNDDTTTVGTFGGGVEWAFAPNWSIKAEYMFIALGDENRISCGNATLASGAVVPGGAFCFNTSFPDIHTIKVGVNWRFGSLFGWQ